MDQDSEYLLTLKPEEIVRLGYQHEVFANETTRLMREARVGPGHHFLDIGCGPGFVTAEAARLVGDTGAVTAVDQSAKCIASSKRLIEASGLSNVRFVQSDVLDLALEKQYDYAFARWVLCFVSDLPKAFDTIMHHLKPGGRLMIFDYMGYDHALAPPTDALTPIVDAVQESVRRVGGDLQITLKVPELVKKHSAMIEYRMPIQPIGQAGDVVWQWVESFYHSFLPSLVEQGLLADASLQHFWQQWSERKQDPNAFLFGMPMIGLIVRKP